MQNKPILVIGASGKTGARVAQRLTDAGHSVRAGTRRAPIPFDWDDQSSWAAALDGVCAAYVTYFPDLAAPGATDKIGALTEIAKAAGGPRLVLLSGRGETHAKASEEIVKASGIDHTLIRSSWFAQNFSEGYLRPAVMSGVLALPAGLVREPITDVDDIADVAAAALTDPRHSGALYEITGPDLLNFDEIAAILSRESGRPLRYQPISLADFRTAIDEIAGAYIADVFAHVCEEALDGRNAWLGDGVERALGRPARRFADYCRAAAAHGAWRDAA